MDSSHSVLVTRNATSFQRLRSPLARLSSDLFALLTSRTELGAQLRSGFAYSVTPAGIAPSAHLVDRLALSYLSIAPSIVVLRGKLSAGDLLDAPRSPPSSACSDAPSFGSMLDLPPSLRDSIILPWSLHAGLVAAERDGDEELRKKLAVMALVSIIHETAHYLATRVNAPPTSARRVPSPRLGVKCKEQTMDLKARRFDDYGAIADVCFFGMVMKLVTFADGTSELICRRIKTAIDREDAPVAPLFTVQLLSQLIRGPLPTIRNVTRYRRCQLGDRPVWRGDSDDTLSTIVAALAPNAMCHHAHSTMN